DYYCGAWDSSLSTLLF
nr:immunoglobulin light chain junction region [Macaca mulatta]MOX79171.1 immunoglobulin light chain junction region [Macaca mulatta]MOX80197.1 immunoglobulin light chain junction region [Macaca mulatta]MOX82893.1 immunoglobulin light chain junction region [Macaca mulatta]MOX83202.1 immunoglobulin light chain junction region [Macaca mulatta]